MCFQGLFSGSALNFLDIIAYILGLTPQSYKIVVQFQESHFETKIIRKRKQVFLIKALFLLWWKNLHQKVNTLGGQGRWITGSGDSDHPG